MAKRHPASVYRRRRIVVALVAVAVIAFVWWGVAALVGGTARSEAGPTPTTSETSAPVSTTPEPEPSSESPEASGEEAPTPTPTTAADCTAETVIVEAFTDAPSYPDGVQPQFTLRVTNAGEAPCVMDIGTATQVYTVTSGADTIWVSTHCQENPANDVVQLEPGQSLNAPAITWVRERSTPDTCDSERPAATGGGATYNLIVSIGGITSAPASFVLE